MGFGIKSRANYIISYFKDFPYLIKYNSKRSKIGDYDITNWGNWFVDKDDITSYLGRYKYKIICHADLCLKNYFSILGTGQICWGDQTNWHQDIKSKRVWPLHYYKRLLCNLTGIKGSDVKIPWELSRFQHLMLLVAAYRVSKDIKYAEGAMRQIRDWTINNPFLYGVNWTNAMEVAIRACNWLWACWAFRDNPAWTDKFNEKFLKSMWQHGWYIEHNLENKGGIRTNHYLSDIVGLLFIAIMFPQFKDSERWRKFSVSQLVHCMEEMVYPDGVSFENSTAYHRLVLELFTYSAILCQRNGIELPQQFWERLEKMFEFIMNCIRPDGHMPMIGDNDDGRFFIFSNYFNWDRWDFRYLLSIGAVLHNRHDFKDAAGKFHAEVAWLLGTEGIEKWRMI